MKTAVTFLFAALLALASTPRAMAAEWSLYNEANGAIELNDGDVFYAYLDARETGTVTSEQVADWCAINNADPSHYVVHVYAESAGWEWVGDWVVDATAPGGGYLIDRLYVIFEE